MKKVDIYTDGACSGNPGRGGWAAILVYGAREAELSGFEPQTTNNRMELTAAIEALSALKEPCDVMLCSDSTYLVNAINKGWLEAWKKKGFKKTATTQVPNTDLWIKLDRQLSRHKIELVWVRGHDGHEYNERCDRLATAFADSL